MASEGIVNNLISSCYVGKYLLLFKASGIDINQTHGEAVIQTDVLHLRLIEGSKWNGVLEEIGFPLKTKRERFLGSFGYYNNLKVKKTRSSKNFRLETNFDERLDVKTTIYLQIRVTGVTNPDQDDLFSFDVIMTY